VCGARARARVRVARARAQIYIYVYIYFHSIIKSPNYKRKNLLNTIYSSSV